MDNNIIFDEKSIEYIIRNRCDKVGQLKYMDVIKDMVIKTEPDRTGQLVARWHMKQCLQPKNTNNS
jgi:hypothetical protein